MHASSRHHPGGAGQRGSHAATHRPGNTNGLGASPRGRSSMLVGTLATMVVIGVVVAAAYDGLATHNANIGESVRSVMPAILANHLPASAAGGVSSATGAAASANSVVPSSGDVPGAGSAQSAPSAQSAQSAQTSQQQAQANADDRRNTAVINSLARHHPLLAPVAPHGRHGSRNASGAASPYGHH